MTVSGMEGGRLVAGMDTCGGAGGGEAGGRSLWWLERRRERNYRNGAVGAGFLSTLNPIFSFFRHNGVQKLQLNSPAYFLHIASDTTKRLMSSPKCRSVEVINNPARPGSNHREVNCINYK